jgi:hypothetical protein
MDFDTDLGMILQVFLCTILETDRKIAWATPYVWKIQRFAPPLRSKMRWESIRPSRSLSFQDIYSFDRLKMYTLSAFRLRKQDFTFPYRADDAFRVAFPCLRRVITKVTCDARVEDEHWSKFSENVSRPNGPAGCKDCRVYFCDLSSSFASNPNAKVRYIEQASCLQRQTRCNLICAQGIQRPTELWASASMLWTHGWHWQRKVKTSNKGRFPLSEQDIIAKAFFLQMSRHGFVCKQRKYMISSCVCIVLHWARSFLAFEIFTRSKGQDSFHPLTIWIDHWCARRWRILNASESPSWEDSSQSVLMCSHRKTKLVTEKIHDFTGPRP